MPTLRGSGSTSQPHPFTSSNWHTKQNKTQQVNCATEAADRCQKSGWNGGGRCLGSRSSCREPSLKCADSLSAPCNVGPWSARFATAPPGDTTWLGTKAKGSRTANVQNIPRLVPFSNFAALVPGQPTPGGTYPPTTGLGTSAPPTAPATSAAPPCVP